MDLLDSYKDKLTEEFDGAEVLGKKVKVKLVDNGLRIWDENDLLKDYDHEYILLAIIFDNDEKHVATLYDGKFIKEGGRMYLVDTTQRDPNRVQLDLERWLKDYQPQPPFNPPYVRTTPYEPQPGVIWTTTTTPTAGGHTISSPTDDQWMTYTAPVLHTDETNRNNTVYLSDVHYGSGGWNNADISFSSDGSVILRGEVHGPAERV